MDRQDNFDPMMTDVEKAEAKSARRVQEAAMLGCKPRNPPAKQPSSPGLSSHNSTGMSDDDARVHHDDMNFDDFNATMVQAREFLAATTKAKNDSAQNETRFL